MYAINLADLMGVSRVDALALSILLDPILDREHVIAVATDRFDEMGVALNCDETRAGAIVEIIRLKFKRHKLRMYHSVTGAGGWVRV